MSNRTTIPAVLAVFMAVILCGCDKHQPNIAAKSDRSKSAKNAPPPREVVLSESGKAFFPIVISSAASDKTKSNAKTLSRYLHRITGADFAVEVGDGSKGIALGIQKNFKSLPKRATLDFASPTRAEEYLIRSHPKGLLLVGATDIAVQNAMWDFLFRIGYRQYFPGKTWEVVPKTAKLAFAADDFEKPDFIMRRVWFGYGTYKENKLRHADWRAKNRLAGSFNVNAGHSYGGFIARHKKEFEEHPEYYALVNGRREGPKMNIANPELRKLFIDSKLKALKRNPNLTSVSVDPSDGGGWDQSPERLKIGSGSPSDQAVFLANQVAEAIKREFRGREIYVGMYAYYKHSAPPTIKVNEKVRVLVATAFRNTPLSLREQMLGWSKMGASLGTRDYLSYAAANYDVPSRCGGAFNFTGLARKYKNLHDWGSVLYSGESSDNWGINGLLYFAAGRLLWNVDDEKQTKNLLREFIDNCFGPVADEITKYYHALSPAASPALEPQLFRKLYDAINAAKSKKPKKIIEKRLDDLILYTRYLELYRRYVTQRDPSKRLAAAKKLFSHLYKTRKHSVNASLALIRDLSNRDKIVRNGLTKKELRSLQRGLPLWEKKDSYSRDEINAMLSNGIKNNPKLDFEPMVFSRDLVPGTPLLAKLHAAERGKSAKIAIPRGWGAQGGHAQMYYTWADTPGTEWKISLTASDTHGGRGKIKVLHPEIELWSAKMAGVEPVAKIKLEIKNGETGRFLLKSPYAGLHWVILRGARWQNTLILDPRRY